MSRSEISIFVEGGAAFNVAISVTPSEMARWKPERIEAFFAGVAKVLRAKFTEEWPKEPPESQSSDESAAPVVEEKVCE